MGAEEGLHAAESVWQVAFQQRDGAKQMPKQRAKFGLIGIYGLKPAIIIGSFCPCHVFAGVFPDDYLPMTDCSFPLARFAAVGPSPVVAKSMRVGSC